MRLNPSKAAMREAQAVLAKFLYSPELAEAIALALDRHAAAQRKKDASVVCDWFEVKDCRLAAAIRSSKNSEV